MTMRICFSLCAVCFVLGTVHAIEPVNPDASPEARAVLDYLYEMKGKGLLAGQH